jgi:hypothetical protein
MNEELERILASINDAPDPAHGDYTPAVHGLIRQGLPALQAVLPLLESEDRYTRMRAQRVLEGVTRAWVKARTADPPLTRRADRAWLELWQSNGDYDWEAGADARSAAIERWKVWLQTASH